MNSAETVLLTSPVVFLIMGNCCTNIFFQNSEEIEHIGHNNAKWEAKTF